MLLIRNITRVSISEWIHKFSFSLSETQQASDLTRYIQKYQ